MLFRKSKPTTSPAEVNDLSTALSFSQLVARADLEHHARHLAIKSEPRRDHPGLTIPERDTLDLVEQRIAARNAEIDALSTVLSQQLLTIAPNPDHDPATQQHRTVDGLTRIVTDRAPVIRATLAAEKVRRAELTAWRDAHHIARPAEYPKAKLVHFRWVGVIAILEALAQSSLLMPATPDGLVGAVALALIITTLTTGIGIMIGLVGFRYLAASKPTQRLGGWMALASLSTVLACVILYLAHYRHLAGSAGDALVEAEVMARLIASPLDLSGPAWFLLLLTLACASFAAWKGYTASDPIPGYEKIDRAYADARDDLDYVRADLQGAIAGLKTHAVAPLLAQPRLARIKHDHLLASYAELEEKHKRATALAQQEEALTRRAIAHFRQVNLATRADGVTPGYFKEQLTVPAEVLPLPVHLKERIDGGMAVAIADAAKTSALGLELSRMLERTSDRADEIMTSIDQATARDGDGPLLSLRTALETTLAAPALPGPDGKIAAPALPAAHA